MEEVFNENNEKKKEEKINSLQSQLDNEKHNRYRDNEGLSKYISLLCQISVVSIVLVGLLSLILVLIPNGTDIDHKEFIIGIEITVMTAVVIIMVLARKNPFVLITMMGMGIFIFSFGLGYLVCNFSTP